MDAASALGSTLFYGLPRAELTELARLSRLRRYERGRYVWREGDAAETLIVIASGRLKISRVEVDGNEYVLRVLEQGDSDGEPGLFAPEHQRLTDLQAIERTECVETEGEALLGFLERHPLALRRMLERLAVNARHQTAMLTEIAFHDIGSRVARVLLGMARRRGRGQRIQLSQRMLGGLVAASRENVNRALSRFVQAGAIRMEDGHILVLDAEALEGFTVEGRLESRFASRAR